MTKRRKVQELEWGRCFFAGADASGTTFVSNARYRRFVSALDVQPFTVVPFVVDFVWANEMRKAGVHPEAAIRLRYGAWLVAIRKKAAEERSKR